MANFNSVPTIHAPRSKFDMSFSHKTSGNVGTLYPFYLQEVYPGDVFEVDTSFVARLTSAYIRPVMDDLFLDTYYFFVPNRLVFEKWQQVFGENVSSAWVQSSPVAAPTLPDDVAATSYNVVLEGSVADHFGLPLVSVASSTYLPKGINVIPFRSFALCYDYWFRDENIIPPMHIQKGDTSTAEYLNGNPWQANNYTGMCPKVSRFKDYFSTCLPGPQKSDPVSIPVVGPAPLKVGSSTYTVGSSTSPITFAPTGTVSSFYLGFKNNGLLGYGNSGVSINNPNSWDTNLVADLQATGVMATINDLRMAFQLQKIFERSARSGTRYGEYILSAFNVQNPDSRLQIPEYLGGKRQPLSTQQVAQTSASNSDGDLGSLAAFSLSNGKSGFSKGFTEHGFIIGVWCIRQRHTYQQGIEKFWSRSERFSYYDPTLANIGEQPVYKDELFGIHSSILDPINSTPFGYQEAWADLRYRPNIITGSMRSDATNSLDIWHFGDDYANAPTLNGAWLLEDATNIDRCLAVPSTSLDQFIIDFYVKNYGTRRIPTYSVPSLVDHG